MYKILVYVVFCITAASAQDYCSICSNHTMCLYKSISTTCGIPIKVGLEEHEIYDILNTHNELRNIVALGQETRGCPGPQPAASNMRKMSWDYEMATIAQRWAEQCHYSYDSCRNLLSESFWVNQCLFFGSATYLISNYPFGDILRNEWFGEVAKFDPGDINPFNYVAGIQDYSQIVWAETYLVGCGFIAYPIEEGYQHYLVCNYGPGGDVINGTMYLSGTPTSNCPSGTSQDEAYLGLCS